MRNPITGSLNDFREAKSIVESAARRHETAAAKAKTQEKTTTTELSALGQLEVGIYDGEVRRFVEAFKRLKNRQEMTALESTRMAHIDSEAVLEIEDVDFHAVDVAKALLAGGTAGTASAGAAVFAVSSFATASTGAAISGLSGVAAHSALLAALGGGSLAAGGAGMAGGAAVLGGVFAAPLLVVGAFVIDGQAKKSLERPKPRDLRPTVRSLSSRPPVPNWASLRSMLAV